jgi:hypothetical protein
LCVDCFTNAATSAIDVATLSAPSLPLLLHRLRSKRPRRRRAQGLDIRTLHCALASPGGSASPRLCVQELTLMIFDSIAMIFESVIKTFDSITMIFDSVIMTFEPSIKIFDFVVMIFESSIKIL